MGQHGQCADRRGIVYPGSFGTSDQIDFIGLGQACDRSNQSIRPGKRVESKKPLQGLTVCPCRIVSARCQPIEYRRHQRAMQPFTITCPVCRETDRRHQVARAEYPPLAPQVVGGIVAALVFELSRKRRFRCERCGEIFSSHTVGSRLWLALWILFWVSVGLGLVNLYLDGPKQ